MVFVFWLDWQGETRMWQKTKWFDDNNATSLIFVCSNTWTSCKPGWEGSTWKTWRECGHRSTNQNPHNQLHPLSPAIHHWRLLPSTYLGLASFWLSSLSVHVISSVSRKDRPFIEQYFLGLDNKPKPKVCKSRTSRTIELIRNSINTKWGVKLGYLTR